MQRIETWNGSEAANGEFSIGCLRMVKLEALRLAALQLNKANFFCDRKPYSDQPNPNHKLSALWLNYELDVNFAIVVMSFHVDLMT